jgi:hypothetical protein
MAGFFDQVLKGFLGSDYLKDYRHASKTFRSAGMDLHPRHKFLFHVYFNLNIAGLPGLRNSFSVDDQSRVSLLVKNIQLPNYTIDVDTLNQYNRKRLVQSKINYEPVTIEFHDDGADLVRNLWFKYYSYYYKDPSQLYGSQTANTALTNNAPGMPSDANVRDIYNSNRMGNDWGYIAEDGAQRGATPGEKPSFFKDITIYGFNQHQFVNYTLVNPMITEFRHDTYDYSNGSDPMSNQMTIRYETVKYGAGALNGETGAPIPGFADPAYYDKEPSALSRPGSRATVFGQGGLLDAGVGIFEDLATGDVLGAAKKAGRVYDIIDNGDLNSESVKEEVLTGVIREGLPAVTDTVFNFATPGTGTKTNTPTLATPTEITPTNTLVSSNGQNVGTSE